MILMNVICYFRNTMAVQRLVQSFFAFFFLLCSFSNQAQEIHFSDSLKSYNKIRLFTDAKGMNKLTIWGGVNVATGLGGMLLSKDEQFQYFSGMNLAWGAVNSTIGLLVMQKLKRQSLSPYDGRKYYLDYKTGKKAYVINIGLDGVYMLSGALMMAHSKNDLTHENMWQGFGKSVIIQGIFLLVFDNVMYYSHDKYNRKWLRILSEMEFTGNGIGIPIK